MFSPFWDHFGAYNLKIKDFMDEMERLRRFLPS